MIRSSFLACTLLALLACGGGGAKGPNEGDDDDDGGGSGSGSNPSGSEPFVIPLTTPDGPIEFYAPLLTVNGVKFAMDLDTGSTTTALAGSACSDCSGSGFTLSPLYTPGPMAVDQGSNGESEYADGTGWAGEIYKDTISLGDGSPSATLNIVDISTQVVPDGGMTGFFSDNGYQGILGMGAPENAIADTGAYFQTITQSGVTPTMAFELCPASGTMWLGGFDSTHAQAAPQYTPMLPIDADNNPFYAIDITGMSLNGSSAGTGSATFEEPVVDTGTSLFYLPTTVEASLIKSLNASMAFKSLFPGTTLKDDPNGTGIGCTKASNVTDAQVEAMLPPLVINMPNKAGGSDLAISVPPLESYLIDAGSGQFCLGIENGGSQDATTMGDMIMQAFVTVIDVQNSQVGWALDKGCDLPRAPRDFSTFRPHRPKPQAALRHRNK